jgi:hypothetical protein
LAVKLIILLVLALAPFIVDNAFASRHEGICWANPGADLCGCMTKPFACMIAPFETIAPGYGLLFIWGPVVFGLWFSTKSPAIAGIFGMIVAAVFTGGVVVGDETISLNSDAVGMGMILVAVSAGIGLIQIFQRLKQVA